MTTINSTLDELDRLAAEKVMGWYLKPIYSMFEVSDEIYSDGKDKEIDIEDWLPTRNIAQAWECLEKISKSNSYLYKLEGPYGGTYKWHVSQRLPDNQLTIMWTIEEETASLAITKACLKAVGVEIET